MDNREREIRVNRFEDVKTGMADLQSLEAKVQRVVDRIAELKRENRGLLERVESLESIRQQQEVQLKGLQDELAHARANGRDRTREEAIRKRVEGLLQRLEGL